MTTRLKGGRTKEASPRAENADSLAPSPRRNAHGRKAGTSWAGKSLPLGFSLAWRTIHAAIPRRKRAGAESLVIGKPQTSRTQTCRNRTSESTASGEGRRMPARQRDLSPDSQSPFSKSVYIIYIIGRKKSRWKAPSEIPIFGLYPLFVVLLMISICICFKDLQIFSVLNLSCFEFESFGRQSRPDIL